METHRKRKVEIVVDAAHVESVIAIVEKHGAKGYTVIDEIHGKGHRGLRAGHDIFAKGRNALVIVIASPAIGDAILADAVALLRTRAGIAYASDVDVAREDYF